jgi:IclR family acetate operon transcriptional repressor
MAAPLAASANGKAILATRSHAEIETLLDRGLSAYTPTTVTDREELLAELETIRRRGYATNSEEWRSGVSAVAAAITADGGPAVAGISLSMPSQRMNRKLQAQYGLLVKDAASRISAALGRRG